MAGNHSKKDIRKAIRYAEQAGWTLRLSNGHAFGHLYCGGECRRPVWSTPRNPHNHAKDIYKAVDRCRCFETEDEPENEEKKGEQ